MATGRWQMRGPALDLPCRRAKAPALPGRSNVLTAGLALSASARRKGRAALSCHGEILDSKVSLLDYGTAVSANTMDEQANALEQHAKAIKNNISMEQFPR